MPSCLLFGSTGRTGSVVKPFFEGAGYTVLAPTHDELPLEDIKALEAYLLAHPTDIIINCAAISALEQCPQDALLTHYLNVMAPAAMAQVAKHTGAHFIHLSTDYVLDGRKAGLKHEGDKCRPLSLYAQSKEEAEYQVREANEASLIMRVSWVCGYPKKPSFVEGVFQKALAGEALAAVDDKFSLPTYAGDIARACLILGEKRVSGTVQVTSSSAKPLSWWECSVMALELMKSRGLIEEVPPVQAQKLAAIAAFREPRPAHTAMSNDKLTHQLGVPMLTAEQTIAAALDQFMAAR